MGGILDLNLCPEGLAVIVIDAMDEVENDKVYSWTPTLEVAVSLAFMS